MYDRYDSNKGRYVTYDYQPKGDGFSRGLAARPRVYTTVNNYNTGHSAIRRVCTSRTQHLTVSAIKAMFPEEIASKLEHLTLYFKDTPETLLIHAEPDQGGFSVRFEVTEQAKGKRHWFKCVECWRRVGKLYVVKTQEGKVWGCQKCLGLVYPSQAQHKTQARDRAIGEGKIKVSFKEWVRASEREEQRMQRLIGRLERLTSGLD